MSNDKIEKEELKKLEDEAYLELRQIIDEAMQLQDIELLNARISIWKSKYKKLLDGSVSNSNFKKRIEYLLNQYYSNVTQYIFSQIKIKEEKKIENQRKALRKLYNIIKETNDLSLLKKKVKEWEAKYPISAFLNMYKNKIELAITNKNLERNAFDQEKAFYDLYQITKINGTFDELKIALSDWEKKYSIHDKYKLDDFIKNQSDVKRYSSDEYLQSISNSKDDENSSQIIDSYTSTSSINKQTEAYSALLSISNKPNNVNQVFDWVYKYNSVKFNDKYKELILAATYLDYSPKYLSSMKIPNIDLSKSDLSKDEYKQMPEILRYAVISYFNLLLPPEQAVSNNYFNKHIQALYYKSEESKHSKSTSIDELISSGIEIPLVNKSEKTLESNSNSKESEELITKDVDTPNQVTSSEIETKDPSTQEITVLDDKLNQHSVKKFTVSETKYEKSNIDKFPINYNSQHNESTLEDSSVSDIEINQPVSNVPKVEAEQPMDYNTIVALSPMFFEAINYYNEQAITIANQSSVKHTSTPTKTKTIDIDKSKV